MELPDDYQLNLEKLHIENEMKRLKFALRYDVPARTWAELNIGVIVHSDDSLRVEMYEYVGRPLYYPSVHLTDAEIGPELNRLLAVMLERGVVFDVLMPNDHTQREIYEHVVGWLFYEEIDLRRVGPVVSVVYEAQLLDHPRDVAANCNEFVGLLTNGNFQEFPWCLDGKFYEPNGPQEKPVPLPWVRRRLADWVDSWHPLVIRDGYAHHVVVGKYNDDDTRTATARLTLLLGRKGQAPYRTLEGTVQLTGLDGAWWVTRVVFGDWVLE